MKNSVIIIALLLIVTCNISGTNFYTLAQDKKDITNIDTVKTTLKKTIVLKDWKETKKENKDKSIGKTKDGKIIYEGPRGGRYYISEKGRKVYIKKN
jgi:uncharacterized protein YycO